MVKSLSPLPTVVRKKGLVGGIAGERRGYFGRFGWFIPPISRLVARGEGECPMRYEGWGDVKTNIGVVVVVYIEIFCFFAVFFERVGGRWKVCVCLK